MAPAPKWLVSKNLDVADVATNYTRRSVLSRRKSPVLEELFAEHHYDSEKGYYTQARNDGGTNWSDSDNREETASSKTRGSKDVEDSDTSEDDMCDVSSPLMRRMSCPPADGYSPRRRKSCSSSPKKLSEDAHPMRRMGCRDTSARGQPMHRMGFARLQARFRPLRDQEQPLSSYKSPTRIFTTEVLELSSDDSPVRKATPPTKFRAKDLRVDVPDDDISWLQQTPLTQNNTSASSPLSLLDMSPITMLGEGNLFLSQTSASPVCPRRLSFSLSSDGSGDFFKELSGSHHGSTSTPVSARQDQSEPNTNSQGGTTICSGDLSTTQPQHGPSTEVHRYRETLREDKQSHRRSTPGSCKVNSKECQKQFYKKHLGTFSLKKVSRKLCCAQNCLRNVLVATVQEERHFYFRLSRDERSLFLDSRHSGGQKSRKYVLRSGVVVCRRAFINIFCVGESKLVRIQNTLSDNPTTRHGFIRDRTTEGFMLQELLDKIFLTHCERQPNAEAYHLPSNLSKAEMRQSLVYDYIDNSRVKKELPVDAVAIKLYLAPTKRLFDWEGPLPATLYIQLDNTVRENKNGIVFAYLAMLVEKKIFRKIKVGFLIVGHTHDHVDQMFSRFSVALRGKKAFTMPQMQQIIQEAYVPSPVFEVLEETWDFKTIVQLRPSPVLPLHDITFNQQFKIALGGDNWPRLWTKKFSYILHS
ncbi:hypothetical protein R1sor_024974 [Riccia sorocarpa]|uniref:DUF7869 domain-containing protein n=1 Tax=Riccia sorocarpa TaxID=122646 RepID=A0ABD3GAW2_9MARC